MMVDLSAYGGVSGDTISIQAHDDLKVRQVWVVIRENNGNELERGKAEEAFTDSGQWVY